MVKSIVFILMVMAVPCWLYASGNLPVSLPVDKRIVEVVNACFPGLCKVTYQESHRLFEKSRRAGIDLPYSPNERMIEIKRIRMEVKAICDSILSER